MRNSRIFLGSTCLATFCVLAFCIHFSLGKPAIEDLPVDNKLFPKQSPSELETVWSVDGSCSGLTTSADGLTIYALDRPKKLVVLDTNGKKTKTIPLGWDTDLVRMARSLDKTERLIGFGVWSPSFFAFKDGGKLWEEPGGDGVDDVWAADLNGDGIDELIVGYNGATGLHVFSNDGKRLWKHTGIGNVWHVTAGDVDGDGKPEVVSTSAEGRVHLFDANDGKPLKILHGSLYANMVRTAPSKAIPSSKGDSILLVGTDIEQEAMVAMSGDGKIHWKTPLPTAARRCAELAISPDGAWAGVGYDGGFLAVLDVATGQIVASSTKRGISSVSWCKQPNGEKPLFLVGSSDGITAFRVKARKVP
jgi:hypothetical protein